MKITIIGAGAMGSLFGGYLSRQGNDVLLLDVRADHVAQINRFGLQIVEPGQTVITHPRAATSAVGETPAGLVIVLVKAADTLAALTANQCVLGSDTLVLTLQNGLGNAEVLAQFTDPDRIMAGTTAHGCQMPEPGCILHAGSGPTIIGAYRGLPAARLRDIAALMTGAGLETTVAADIMRQVWQKLLVNIGINPVSALLQMTNGELAQHEETRWLMRSLITEAVAVAGRAGYNFDIDEAYAKCLAVAAGTAANRSSMLQDITLKRPGEIRQINGAVVDLGQQYGVPVPCNQMVTQMILALEIKNQSLSGQPY